jgi:hypothetical protein
MLGVDMDVFSRSFAGDNARQLAMFREVVAFRDTRQVHAARIVQLAQAARRDDHSGNATSRGTLSRLASLTAVACDVNRGPAPRHVAWREPVAMVDYGSAGTSFLVADSLNKLQARHHRSAAGHHGIGTDLARFAQLI